MIAALLMAQAVALAPATYTDTLTGQVVPASEIVWLRYVWQPRERFYQPLAWFHSEAACRASSAPPGRGPGGGLPRTFCGALGYGQRAMGMK